MTNEQDDNKFHEAMAALAHWRSKNPDIGPDKEPDEISKKRLFVMERISNLKEGDTDPWLGHKIKVLVRKSTRYIVYLDDKLEIQWWWTQRLSSEEGLSIIQASVAHLSCESEFLLDKNNDLRRHGYFWWKTNDGDQKSMEKAKGVRSLIAESMAMVLNGVQLTECKTVQAVAAQQILIEKDKMCRRVYLIYFLQILGIFGVISYFLLLLISSEFAEPSKEFISKVASLVYIATAGVFGAFVSSMSRTQKLALEPELGRRGLESEAVSRAFIGAGVAVLAYFAFESGLIIKGALASDSTKLEAMHYFLAMAAGASERILPALINRAEGLMNLNERAKADHK